MERKEQSGEPGGVEVEAEAKEAPADERVDDVQSAFGTLAAVAIRVLPVDEERGVGTLIGERRDPFLVVIDDFLGAEQCATLCSCVDETVPGRGVKRVSYANHPELTTRELWKVVVQDPELVDRMQRQLGPLIPRYWEGGEQFCMLDPSLRVYRYDAAGDDEDDRDADRFGLHYDATEERDLISGDTGDTFTFTAALTLLVYLSDCEPGEGELVLYDTHTTGQPTVCAKVLPRRGRAVILDHTVLHEARPVRSAAKFTLRTDLLYTRYMRAMRMSSWTPKEV